LNSGYDSIFFKTNLIYSKDLRSFEFEFTGSGIPFRNFGEATLEMLIGLHPLDSLCLRNANVSYIESIHILLFKDLFKLLELKYVLNKSISRFLTK